MATSFRSVETRRRSCKKFVGEGILYCELTDYSLSSRFLYPPQAVIVPPPAPSQLPTVNYSWNNL